ncbi:MAG TPA: hypothetical protein VFQ35_07585 [Polyangiaceae bacterium]|nr:hypothetical protein [Polyangiaceae bacterium]
MRQPTCDCSMSLSTKLPKQMRLRSALAANARRFVLGGMLAMCITRPASADDEATTSIARERFKEGVQFFDQKQFEKARAAFLQAYALKRHPAVLLNLAQSELRSGHEADAAKHFAQYLREAKEATEAERQAADSGLSAAKAVVAEVAVVVDEDGAVVSVDGTAEGQTPLPGPVYLSPGAHTLSAKKDARETSQSVTAVAGQSTSTNLRFRKASPAADAGERQKPENTAKPPTPVSPPVSNTPVEPAPSEGSARRRQGFFEWASDSPVAWIGGGVTALGLAGGIGFALGAKHNYDNADETAARIATEAKKDGLSSTKGLCVGRADSMIPSNRLADYREACGLYSDYVDKGDKMKTLSIVSWVVAGTAAATTLIVYAASGTVPAKETAQRSRGFKAHVAPWISGTERGVFVGGSF